MKPAFSTLACPEWTFLRLAEQAAKWGFLGCELRTFGYGSTQFACDPALTSPAKARLLLERAGVEVVSLATSIRYDEPITPPVLGYVFGDTEKSVRESKGAIDLAVRLECPYVRVFGFEIIGSEARRRALVRISDRLRKAADHARNSGVKLLVENGGSFSTAVQLSELLDAVGSELVEAAYSVPVAALAGEKASNGINVLGEKLACVKLRDYKGGRPCALGEGEFDNRGAVEALARAGFAGWVVYEYDRAWFKDEPLADVDQVMRTSAMELFEWIERGRGLSKRPDLERVGP
jgi:sugar phosphate isomerase/epimerase